MSNELFDTGAIDSILARYTPLGRPALLEALLATQAAYGHISPPAARALSSALGVPLADLYGVVEFYAMLTTEPAGRHVIRICDDPVCHARGSAALLVATCARLDIAPNQTTADGAYTIERSPCLGLCEHAPAALVDSTPLAHVSTGRLDDLLAGRGERPEPMLGGTERVLTVRCESGDPLSLERYVAEGGYVALRKALLEMSPEGVIAAVKESGLVGRGGAAFPAGTKWEAVARSRAASGTPAHVVCNADESEPGTFSNRVLMEADPYAVLEAMAICGYAVGAAQGWLYVRGEYPRAQAILAEALARARSAGLLGDGILGTAFSFDIQLRSGAGAYICGEETALFESLEGKRGFPRIKPPYPTTHGLFGQPTVVNNVETLVNVLPLLTRGVAWFRDLGTSRSSGTKLFCVSGHVQRPGLYEAPFGIALGSLLDLAGGVPGGIQAVLIGGAAGAFVGPDALDMPMSFEGTAARGVALGSGAVMAFDRSADLRDLLAVIARFFAHESCGKCFPCQLGTQRQHEILGRVADGQARPGDAERLRDLGVTMSETSLCGLGQTAAMATLSALRLWPDLISTNHQASPAADAGVV